jgi:hypothetical protein
MEQPGAGFPSGRPQYETTSFSLLESDARWP